MTGTFSSIPLGAFGRFTLTSCLGEGGSGTVYRAIDGDTSTVLALKVLRDSSAASLFRFKREFRALAGIAHPNLVQLHQLLHEQGTWFLTMELVEGSDFLEFVRPPGPDSGPQATSGLEPVEDSPVMSAIPKVENDTLSGWRKSETPKMENDTLSEWRQPETPLAVPRGAARRVRNLGSLDEGRLRRGLAQLADGLHALHAANQLHLDLKPSNVLVRATDGHIKICDFGLVREASSRAAFGIPRVAGTVAYMAPEQARLDSLSRATDWYAFGVMLYQALTGKLPFPGHLSLDEAAVAKSTETPTDPREFDATLSPDLSDLALALLRPVPDDRPDYATVIRSLRGAARSSSRAPGPRALIGRHEALTLLTGAYAKMAKDSQPVVAFVAGVSGMGKSALVQHFLEEVAAKEGAVVLRGRCYEREELPYKAFDPLIDGLAAYLDGLDAGTLQELLPDGIEALSRLFPALRLVRLIRERENRAKEVPDHLERRHRAFGAFRELCHRMGRRTPLVLCIDDLQWGDLDSARLFGDLLRAPRAPALLFIGAYRSEDEQTSPFLRALRDQHLRDVNVSPVEVRVGRLSDDESRELSRAILAGSDDAESHVETVVREAEGSPFFVQELADYFRRHGSARSESIRLETLLETRVRDLAPDARQLLSTIAVAGRPETRGVLATASSLEQGSLAAFSMLVSLRLAQSTGARSKDRVDTYHDRIREVAYGLLEPDARASLHRALAHALEAAAESNADALFEHWLAAGELGKAYYYAVKAAERAEAALAFGRSAALYQKALELSGDESRVGELEERRGHVLSYAGRGVEAAEAFFRASKSADTGKATELRSLAVAQLLRCGQVSRAMEELRRDRDLVGFEPPLKESTALRMLLTRRARIRFHRVRLVENEPASPEVLQRLDFLWSIGSAFGMLDTLRGGVYQAEHFLQAVRFGDSYRVARAFALQAAISATANRNPQRTQALLDRGFELAGISNEPHAFSVVIGAAGITRLLEGRFWEAERFSLEGQRIIREQLHGKLAWDAATGIFFGLQATAYLGDVRTIVARVPEMLRDAESRGDLYAAISFRTWNCNWAWLAKNDCPQARHELETAERQWNAQSYQLQHWYITLSIGQLALYEDAPEAAWERLERDWKQMFFLRQIQHTRIEIWFLRARLALALSVRRSDKQLLASASRDARRIAAERAPWTLALSRLIQACGASFESRSDAIGLFRQAEGQFDVLQMRLLAAVARYRRGQLTERDEGDGLVSDAHECMVSLGVDRPDRFAAMLAPIAAQSA
jgi:serine/threonine protein kinase